MNREKRIAAVKASLPRLLLPAAKCMLYALAVVAAIALVALVTSAISDWLLLGVGAALLGVVIVLVSCLVAGGLKRGARRFMAYGNPNLVACPDCGRTISRNAMACPKCGRPMEHKSPLR